MSRILRFSQLQKLTNLLQNKTTVVAGGCFDLLHLGHVTFLQKAKAAGDVLVVLLESDQTIKKLKGNNRPVHSQAVRSQVLSELRSVDYVLLLPHFNSDEKYDKLIQKLSPKVIATTRGDKHDIHKKRQAKKFAAKLLYVTKEIKDHSTTKIINAIVHNKDL